MSLSTSIISPVSIPPLENGDRLTRPEFERRYQAMTQLKKAELIAGVVYMASPVRIKNHGDKNALLSGNLAEVLAILQQGIASQKHQDFCQTLANK
jgi:hypothetical protein